MDPCLHAKAVFFGHSSAGYNELMELGSGRENFLNGLAYNACSKHTRTGVLSRVLNPVYSPVIDTYPK